MSMSTRLELIKAGHDEYKQMYAIAKACNEAGIDPPKEVQEFFQQGVYDFGDISPFGERISTSFLHYDNRGGDPKGVEFIEDGEMNEGFSIDLDKLDPDVRIIRFINSY